MHLVVLEADAGESNPNSFADAEAEAVADVGVFTNGDLDGICTDNALSDDDKAFFGECEKCTAFPFPFPLRGVPPKLWL